MTNLNTALLQTFDPEIVGDVPWRLPFEQAPRPINPLPTMPSCFGPPIEPDEETIVAPKVNADLLEQAIEFADDLKDTISDLMAEASTLECHLLVMAIGDARKAADILTTIKAGRAA